MDLHVEITELRAKNVSILCAVHSTTPLLGLVTLKIPIARDIRTSIQNAAYLHIEKNYNTGCTVDRSVDSDITVPRLLGLPETTRVSEYAYGGSGPATLGDTSKGDKVHFVCDIIASNVSVSVTGHTMLIKCTGFSIVDSVSVVTHLGPHFQLPARFVL